MTTESPFPIGSKVILQNLVKSESYNGKCGIVKSNVDQTTKRMNVQVENKLLAVKPSNLRAHSSSTIGNSNAETSSTPYERMIQAGNKKRKNGQGSGDENKSGKKSKKYHESGPFSCTVCGNKSNDSDFSCNFCEKGLCEECCDRFRYDDKMLRCDLCGYTSCNSMGNGNKSCPKMVPDDDWYDGLPLCKGFVYQDVGSRRVKTLCCSYVLMIQVC